MIEVMNMKNVSDYKFNDKQWKCGTEQYLEYIIYM